MKKMIAIVLVLALAVASLAACGGAQTKGDYTVGVCQLMVHDALDQATKGFSDALNEKMAAAGKTVSIDTQVACENCGFVAYNDQLSCVQWCKYARKCVGDAMYEQMMKIAQQQKEEAKKEKEGAA